MENNKLPNATAVLVLGIFSIVCCCCWGLGLIPGVIALILAAKDMKEYRQNPDLYSNYSNLNIGKVLSIICVSLSGIVLFIFITINILYTEEEIQEFRHNLEIKMQEQQREQEESL
jgi:hypothetical protein